MPRAARGTELLGGKLSGRDTSAHGGCCSECVAPIEGARFASADPSGVGQALRGAVREMPVRASSCGSSTDAAAWRLLHWFDVRLPGAQSVSRVCDLSRTGRGPCTHRVRRKRPCTYRAHCAEPHRRSTSAPSTGCPAHCEAAPPESAACHTNETRRSQESERRSTAEPSRPRPSRRSRSRSTSVEVSLD